MILIAALFLLAAPQAATPIGDPSQWVTTDDYPAAALAADQAGTTVARFDVNESGQIENCTASQSSGSAALDAAACAALTQRARFTPAKDAGGRAVRSSMTRRIRWAIPAEPIVEIGRLTFERGANGRISTCSVGNGTRSVELVESFCEALTARDPGAPPVQSGVLTIPMPEAPSAPRPPEIGRLMFERGGNGRISRCYAQGTGRTAPLDNAFCEALTTTAAGAPPVQNGTLTIAMPN